MVWDDREAVLEPTQLNLRAGLDGDLLPDGHCSLGRLETGRFRGRLDAIDGSLVTGPTGNSDCGP